MKRTNKLKRTGFKRVHCDAAQNSQLNRTRKAALRAGCSLKAGRRMKEWARVWAWLKPRLEAAGRTRCEFWFILYNCSGILDPVHSKKRRMMQGDDIYAVAIGCRTVHDFLDIEFSHAEMERLVMEAIERNGGLILPERKAAA